MKIASAAGVLGQKIQTDSIFNSLVNDQGISRGGVYLQAGHGLLAPKFRDLKNCGRVDASLTLTRRGSQKP